ncbi:hypothetical protein BS17DRAFT_783631 [Gyrodon lividus]|nr:hypothetical protein BS17DRAFT_783631 [Gyrodon lividus]
MSSCAFIPSQRRYLAHTSLNGQVMALYNVAGHHGFTQSYNHGQYPSLHRVRRYPVSPHQGHEESHLTQEQVCRPPHGEYDQHYQIHGPSMPAYGYTAGQESGTATLSSSDSIEISQAFHAMATVPGATDYPYLPDQGMSPTTALSTSPTSNSYSPVSWTTSTHEGSDLDQVWPCDWNYDQGRDGLPSSSGVASGSSNTAPCPVSPPPRQPLDTLAEPQTRSFDNSFSEPLCALPSNTHSPHTGQISHHWSLADAENISQPLTPLSFPHQHSVGHSPRHQGRQHSSLSQNGRSYFGVYHPAQNVAPPSRRKRPARAIECDGFWIDEEELLEGLMATDGKINVHECRWEEHCSPCHLWIRGDKSCIGSHIQKWHGGKPGGDKFEADCRWSTCQKTMLKESISRHVVGIHLREKWKCQGCREEIARKDAYRRHAERSSKEECRNAGALIMYDADARMVDARTALASGGRRRYANA